MILRLSLVYPQVPSIELIEVGTTNVSSLWQPYIYCSRRTKRGTQNLNLSLLSITQSTMNAFGDLTVTSQSVIPSTSATLTMLVSLVATHGNLWSPWWWRYCSRRYQQVEHLARYTLRIFVRLGALVAHAVSRCRLYLYHFLLVFGDILVSLTAVIPTLTCTLSLKQLPRYYHPLLLQARNQEFKSG